MRKLVLTCLFAFAISTMVGCASARTPVTGFAYTDVKAPVTATNSKLENLKKGTSTAKSYVGVVGMGDASIDKAAENGGITEIHHVDYKTRVILGIYAKTKTIVYGK
jgi:hypothetical protein